MRSLQTRPDAVAPGLEWNRTLVMDPVTLQTTGHLRGLTADTVAARSSRRGDDIAGSMERSPVAQTVAATDRMIAGRYRLSTLLGTGGMGSVWLAEDAVLQRAVALKRLTDRDEDDRPSALQEARAAARITHSGVVRVYDVVREDDEDWIVMEALSGEPLSSIIRERGRLTLEEVAGLAVQLLSGLQAIHEADLVHRDIKPSNVQVCRDGRVVITDFGLSSSRGAWGGLRVGAVAGSLSFMAPETLIDGIFGPASDLYALGVTLYMAVEGRSPFDPRGPLELLDSVLSAQPDPALHAGGLEEVLLGLLEKDPERRMDAAHARTCLNATGLVTTTWAGHQPESARPC
jgi:serine/threonine protein kinase